MIWSLADNASDQPQTQKQNQNSSPILKRHSYPTNALSGMTPDQVQQFRDAQTTFHEVEDATDGLGPVFNDSSCGACHPNGGGTSRISNIIGMASNLQWAAGGPVIQLKALPGFSPEAVPTNMPVARRRAMTTMGLGLVGAIADEDLLSVQALQASETPLLAGKANIVKDAVTGAQHVGRIGQKSQHPNSTSFAAEAYLREMGITTPFFPHEEAPYNNQHLLANNPAPTMNDDGEDVVAFGFFMDHLKPPAGISPGRSQQRHVRAGAVIFASIGCAVCHQPTWTTAANADASLDQVTFSPYSDFLLHDMGENGDQILQGTDSMGRLIPGSWMRTTPLWGVGSQTAFWHDASVDTIIGAINKHAGQGSDAKAMFNTLTPTQQQQLLSFLKSL